MDKKEKKGSAIKSIKHVPKHLTSLSFFLLLGIVFILFWGRKTEAFRFDFLQQQMPDFYQHISNFSLSYLLYSGIGYFWLMMGVKFKFLIYFGIALLLANLIYELFISILNTPDITDAYFGFAGIFLGFLFLYSVYRFGLKPNPLAE